MQGFVSQDAIAHVGLRVEHALVEPRFAGGIVIDIRSQYRFIDEVGTGDNAVAEEAARSQHIVIRMEQDVAMVMGTQTHDAVLLEDSVLHSVA